MKHILLYSIFIIFVLSVQPLHAKISVKVNGKTSGTSIVQGDTLSFTISGIPVGATVTTQDWIDLNSNGIVNPSTDVLFFSMSPTDGVASTGDMDSSANGIIHFNMGKVSDVPNEYYIVRVIYGSDTALATYYIKARATLCTMSGTVTKSGVGVANILLDATGVPWGGDRFGLTDANGNYTILTDATVGTTYVVKLMPISIPSGYSVSPSAFNVILSEVYTGINFVITSATGVDQTTSVVPKDFLLNQNYPNPFNPTTTIHYSVSKSGNIKIMVYDLLGREVTTLVNENKPAGNYDIKFDGSKLGSGVYFYKMQAGNFVQTKKLILIK